MMLATAACLERQLDALSCFGDVLVSKRQLTVNLTKTKVIVCEARGTACTDLVFNDKVGERQDTYH